MSIGFIGNNYQSSQDVNSNGSRLELSLQNVLDRYDVIRNSDLDRLSSNAFYNTYDITSRQHYNTYNAEAVSGWAESWYSEYRTVLQMRADSLQKKLQASYNRVLEKAVYTELEPDRKSVFAPYANRTDSLTQTNFTGPISEVLLHDTNSLAPVVPIVVTPPASSFTTLDAYLTSKGITSSPGVPVSSPYFSSIPNLRDSQYQAFHDAITDSYAKSNPPIDPLVASTNPTISKKAKSIADVAIKSLTELMKPQTINGYDIVPADTFTGFGKNSPLQLGTNAAPTGPAGNIVPPPTSTTTITYDVWDSALDVDNTGTPGPGSVAFGDVVANGGSITLTENQTVATATPSATFTGNGYLADGGILSNITLIAPNLLPIGLVGGGVDDRTQVLDQTRAPIAAVTLNLSAGFIAPGGSNGGPETLILPDTAANTYSPSSYFNGDAWVNTSGAVNKSDYFRRSEIIQDGSTPDEYVFYLDDLQPSNSTMSAQIKKLMEDDAFGVYKNGVPAQQLNQFPPKNGILYFKTRYPSSWYFKGDPRLGITGQDSTMPPDNHALPLSGIPNDLINRNYDRPAAGGMEGWTAGNGLYTAIRTGTEAINQATNVLNGIPSAPPITSTVPDPPGVYKYDTGVAANSPVAAGSDAIYSIGIGDAAYNENTGTIDNNYSNIRSIDPAFGGGNDINVADLFKDLPANITDTLLKDANIVADLKASLNDIKRSFVGRQYDDILKGNAYTGDYTSMDVAIIAAVEIGTTATMMNASPLAPLVATEKAVNKAGVSYTLAGSSNALTTDSKFYAVGVGPDLNLGHASAISEGNLRYGTVGLASGAFAIPIPIPIPPTPVVITIWLGGKTQVTEDVVAHTIVDFFSKIKTIMVEYMQTQAYSASSGTVFDTYASKAENHFSEVGFVEGLKKIEIELLGVKIPIGKMIGSIIKGNGAGGSDGMADLIAMGASPLGGEAYKQTLNTANEGTRMFELKQGVQTPETRETDTGAFFATQSFLSQFSMQNMESEYWIGTQQNEEVVDTDFLRSLSTVGTMFLNTMQTLLQLIGGSPDSGQSSIALTAALAAGKMLIDAGLEKDKVNLWNNLFFKDQDHENDMNNAADLAISSPDAALNIVLGATEGLPKAITTFLPYDPTIGALANLNLAPTAGSVGVMAGGQVINSSFKTESYDYLESDHKPFEGDSTFSYPDPPTSMLGTLAGAVGLNGIKDALKAFKPENIMEGYAATMRFQSKAGVSGLAEQMALADLTTPIDHNLANGIGVRAQAGRGSTNGSDGTIWADTELGDINEVYVGTRKVVFNNLENGFNTFNATTLEGKLITDTETSGLAASTLVGDTVSGSTASRETFANAQRYIGADTRAYGRNYDGGGTPNLESFTTNLYTAGGVKYDRKNQYSLSFTTSASGKKLDLQGAQALNPFIGGFIKMAEIEKNKNDSVLMNYDDIDTVNKVRWDSIRDNLGNVVAGNQSATAAATIRKAGATLENTKNIVAYSADDQQFGGSADGTMNELNKTLYEHMHLRADGQNMSLFKEYKDVFNMGYMKNIFITGQSYHPSGGGMTSSIEIRYDPSGGANINKVQDDTRENFNKATNITIAYPAGATVLKLESIKDLFATQTVNIGGDLYTITSINGATKEITISKKNNPGIGLGLLNAVVKDAILIPETQFDPYNSITLEKTRGKASVYLNNYFASKKRASSK